MDAVGTVPLLNFMSALWRMDVQVRNIHSSEENFTETFACFSHDKASIRFSSPLTQSLSHPFTHSLSHSLIHSLIHSLTHSRTNPSSFTFQLVETTEVNDSAETSNRIAKNGTL